MAALRDRDRGVRQEAAEALGKIKSEEVIRPLVEALISETDHWASSAMATALKEVGLDKAVPLFEDILSSEESHARWVAALCLAEGMGGAMQDNLREIVISELVQGAACDDKVFAESCTAALDKLKTRDPGHG